MAVMFEFQTCNVRLTRERAKKGWSGHQINPKRSTSRRQCNSTSIEETPFCYRFVFSRAYHVTLPSGRAIRRIIVVTTTATATAALLRHWIGNDRLVGRRRAHTNPCPFAVVGQRTSITTTRRRLAAASRLYTLSFTSWKNHTHDLRVLQIHSTT